MVLRLRIPAPDEWQDAKCLGFIATGDDYDPWFNDQAEAKAFCNGAADGIICPIREECLIFSLTNNTKDGIWGGMSEVARKALRRRWPMQGRTPRPEWHWMPERLALKGVRLMDLLAEDDDDDDDEDQL
jgi:hypothetical protein